MIARVLRTFVCVALLLGCASACGLDTSERVVSILGPWTGSEELAFRQVLDDFTTRTGVPVTYVGTRALDQVLAEEVQGGTPPDIAVLPSAGELARYARTDSLVPLDSRLGAHTGTGWQEIERLGTRQTYAVPVKAALKGIVWYATKRSTGPIPRTIDDLVAFGSRPVGGDSSPWCLGLGAPPASGWPGTDWIEDIVLHQSGPAVYARWASGRLDWRSPEIERAWTTWASVVGLSRQRSGVSNGALYGDFREATASMFAKPPSCRLEHQGSFAVADYVSSSEFPQPGVDFDYFDFPTARGGTAPPPLVSGDLAAAFTASPDALAVMDFLASTDGQSIWPSRPSGGAFSASVDLPDPVYANDLSKRIGRSVGPPGPVCLDASDSMPAAMSFAFERATLEFVDDPRRLGDILAQLELVRTGIAPGDWLRLSCGT